MRFKLKGYMILERSGVQNANQLALKSQISSPTVARYTNRSDEIQTVDLEILPTLLSRGCGMTSEQILEMKLGDVFELVNGDS